MATTTNYGFSTPDDTGFVKNGALNIRTLGNGVDAAMAYMPQNNQTGTTYTFALTDVTKLITASNASSTTYTIPPQADVVWLTGTILKITNLGAGVVTFAGGVGVSVTNTAQTLIQYQSAQLIRTASNAWTVAPFTSGVSPLSDSAITGTTGSPTTATYTSGFNYKTYRYTGTGSFTLSRAGFVDVFLVGGGAGSGTDITRAGGGAGALIQQTVYLTAGTCNVIIGAGGAQFPVGERPGYTGNPTDIGVGSNVWTYVANGGGGGGGYISAAVIGRQGYYGGSGGGSAGGNNYGGGAAVLVGQGNSGGGAGTNTSFAGGGGGFNGVGGYGSVSNGAGGNGLSSTFVNGATSVDYAGGGGASSNGQTDGANGTGGGGTANTGGGGRSGSGGSGIVVIRVRA